MRREVPSIFSRAIDYLDCRLADRFAKRRGALVDHK
jgi:hypothetical protein